MDSTKLSNILESCHAGGVTAALYAALMPAALLATAPLSGRLTQEQARRIALAAQGFADPRPTGRVDARHLRRVLAQIGLLQLDSVNVFCRTHYMPLFSRLGPYPRDILDTMTGHTAGRVRRELFEYWAHEASLVPVALQPQLRWRMERAHADAWGGMTRIARDNPALLEDVRALVAANGPIRAGATGVARPARKPGEMWNWHDGKIALEYLFWAGEVTAARRVNFERLYDVTERVLAADVLAVPTPSVEQAQRELIRVAARAYGVATEPDLGDYFRLPRAESKARVAELVEAGCRSRWPAGALGPTSGRGRGAHAGWPRGRCCPRSTHSSGSGNAPSGCSASTTASRSTHPRRSAASATTYCHFCWGSRWSPGSISSPTGRPGCSECRRLTSNMAATRTTSLPNSLRNSR
jgi:hypothetical protein